MKRVTSILLLTLSLVLLTGLATAQSQNRVGLVVLLEDGAVETRCVAFDEAEITGYEVLQRSGLELAISDANMGVTVCNIEGTGCPAGDCFCQCKGDPCVYWSYWHQEGGAWQYAVAGAGVVKVSDGDVEGWTWGPGSPTDAPEPPLLSLDEICAVPEATATPAATAMMANDGTETAVVTDAPAGDAAANGNTGWLLYGLFGAIVLGLGGFLFWSQRR